MSEEFEEKAERTGTSSVAIRRKGDVLYEWSGNGWKPTRLSSLTKFVTAFAYGLSFGSDARAALNAPVSTWLPEWSRDLRGSVTVQHLFFHTAGLEDPKPLLGPATSELESKLLSLDVLERPGTSYKYCNAGYLLLGVIIKRVAGLSALDLVSALPDSLTSDGVGWETANDGTVCTDRGCMMTARAFAHLVQVVQDLGVWHGQRILSEDLCRVIPPQTPEGARGLATGPMFEHYQVALVETVAREFGLDSHDARDPMTHENLLEWASRHGISGRAVRAHRLARILLGPRLGWGYDGGNYQIFFVRPNDGLTGVRMTGQDGTPWSTFPLDALQLIGEQHS